MEQQNIILPINEAVEYVANEIVIKRAGYYVKAATHRCVRAKKDMLNEAVFILCIDNEGYVIIDGIKRKVQRGNIIFCDKKTQHEYATSDLKPWSILWVHATGKMVDYFAKKIDSFGRCNLIMINEHIEISNMLKEMVVILKKDTSTLSRLNASNYFGMVLCKVMEDLTKEKNTTSLIASIEKAKKYMEQNIDLKLECEDIANFVGFSKYYLIRKFKEATGYSLMSYFNQQKISRACHLLEFSDYSINEISSQLGFSSPYYFSNSFKKIIGFPPKEYRKKIKMLY